MSEIPAHIAETADAYDLGSFLLQTAHSPKHSNYLYENGAITGALGLRKRIADAYGWDQVTNYSRRHTLHITFDMPKDMVDYSESVTYNIVHTTDEQREVAHTFELKGPSETIPGRQYDAWRHHKDRNKGAPDQAEVVDAHIYSAITAQQLPTMRSTFHRGEALNFGAIVLQANTISFRDQTWEHGPHTLFYTTGLRPLASDLFSHRTWAINDEVKILRNDFTHTTISAEEITNPGVLYSLYSEQYGHG